MVKVEINKVTVIGGGSWATALVKILTEKNVSITWWLRNRGDVKHIMQYHHNPSYLSTVEIHPDKVSTTTNLKEAIESAEVIILAVPSAFVADVLNELEPEELEGKIVVSSIKGMIPHKNCLVTEYLHHYFHTPQTDLAVIGGPCHAEEVAMEKKSYLTIASESITTSRAIADLLSCRFINTTAVSDLWGVEYSAIMKNIIAIACGIAGGMNYGDNFQAVLVSNAMMEITRFLKEIHPTNRDTNASAYLGDLLVTAYSQFSRNRTFGYMVGRGYSVRSAQFEMEMIAEGYYGVKSIFEINKKYKVEMPIILAVYHVVYEKITPMVEFKILEDKLL